MISRIFYTDHAVERMKERGITKEYVRQAFEQPHTTAPGNNGATNLYTDLRGRPIRVTYMKKKNGVVIISVCWRD